MARSGPTRCLLLERVKYAILASRSYRNKERQIEVEAEEDGRSLSH